jgi:oligosaccharide repeat unit polymerase
MDNLYILFILEILLFIWALKRFKYDLFSPSILTIFLFIVATVCNLFSANLWNIHFHNETLIIISVGLVIVLLSENFAANSFQMNRKGILKNEIKPLKISTWKLLTGLSSSIILTFLYYKEIFQIGGFELSAAGSVKQGIIDGEIEMNVLIRQGYKFVIALTFLHSLIFINNCLILKKKFSKNWHHLIPVLCGILISLASGGRLNVFRILFVFMMIYYILWQEKNAWLQKPNRKLTVLSSVVLSAFFSFFIASKNIVKTSESNVDSPIQYLMYYIGGAIQTLNNRIEMKIERWRTDSFGGNVFSGFYDFLNTCKIYNQPTAQRPFFELNEVGGNFDAAANVCTIFGAPYTDFGFIGMCLFIFLLYFIFSKYYYSKIRCSISSYKRNLRLIIFSFCSACIIGLSFFGCTLYFVIGTSGILQLFVVWLVYCFYFSRNQSQYYKL